MNESQFSSFMMLNQHLYGIFAQYINSGRTRAPPETELIEMLPTFQFGARTDRRALQSKFKSWAKRMNFENGCLTLANAGKIIIPKEKCDDLVMYMHSPEHNDIEKVIAQIRMSYSWTRKNFGMDRGVVVHSIMRNCKRDLCVKKMRMEIAKLSNSLCSGSENSTEPEFSSDMTFGMPPPLQYFPSYHYPLAFPIPPMFSPNSIPFQIPIFNNICNMGHSVIRDNNAMEFSMAEKKDANNSEITLGVESKPNENNYVSSPIISSDNMTAPIKMSPIKFKKPRNVHEYKTLMEAVQCKPNEFPGILKDEKTQFLSLLGIAPKIICSSKTLRNFRTELRCKQFMNRGCMIYRERKMLRDRNKMNKCLFQKNAHNYLGILTHKESSKFVEKEKASCKRSEFLKSSKRLNCGPKDSLPNAKRIKISHYGRKLPIEVITIDSSDEETSEINSTQSKSETISDNDLLDTMAELSSDIERNAKNSKHDDDLKKDIDSENFSEDVGQTKCLTTTTELSSSIESSTENSGENNKHGEGLRKDLGSEKFPTEGGQTKILHIKAEASYNIRSGTKNTGENNILGDSLRKDVGSEKSSTEVVQTKLLDIRAEPSSDIESGTQNAGENNKLGNSLRKDAGLEKSSTEGSQTKLVFLQNFCDIILNKKQVTLPETFYNPALNKPKDSNILVGESNLPASQLSALHASKINAVATDSTRYLFPKINPVPIAIRRVTPSNSQSKTTTFEVSHPNNITRIVYPVPVNKVSGSSRFLLLDKEQKGALYILPQQDKPVLPHNIVRSQPQVTLDSEIAKTQISVQSLVSQIRQLKAKHAKVGRSINKKLVRKEEIKVDISEEMRRITAWIYRMKANVNPSMFSGGTEKSVQKLLSQLEIGIHLVREAKKSLMEIENYIDVPVL